MHELIQLWGKVLGEPPAPEQFAIWTESYTSEVVRRAILKTATKNQTMGGSMSQDHRIRFASRVMMTLTEQAAEHAANREQLQAEMSGGGR
jgi:hypothetical protein